MSRLDKKKSFKSFMQVVKCYFHEQKWKEALIFLFFILLSFGFWYLNSLQQEYEIEVDIPIKYKNIPPDLILSDENPSSIAVRIRDKGTVLINYTWPRNFFPIDLNIKEILRTNKDQVFVSKRNLESEISKQLINSTALVSIEPQSFQLQYAELGTKEVPVVVNYDLNLSPGFQISDSIIVNPAIVKIYAEKKKLDTLDAVETTNIELKQANKTSQFTVKLEKLKDVRMEPSEVKVTIPIEEFTEKRIKLPVLCQGIPEGTTVRLFPSTVEVFFNLPLSHFKDIKEEDFEIQIPFSEFEKNQENGELTIHLKKKPSGNIQPILTPDKIEFIIEKNQ